MEVKGQREGQERQREREGGGRGVGEGARKGTQGRVVPGSSLRGGSKRAFKGVNWSLSGGFLDLGSSGFNHLGLKFLKFVEFLGLLVKFGLKTRARARARARLVLVIFQRIPHRGGLASTIDKEALVEGSSSSSFLAQGLPKLARHVFVAEFEQEKNQVLPTNDHARGSPLAENTALLENSHLLLGGALRLEVHGDDGLSNARPDGLLGRAVDQLGIGRGGAGLFPTRFESGLGLVLVGVRTKDPTCRLHH